MKRILFLLAVFLIVGITLSQMEAHSGDVDVTLATYYDGQNQTEVSFEGRPYGSLVTFDGSIGDMTGYAFAYWIVNGVVNKNLPLDHAFVVRHTMEITAVFKPVDQFVVTFMDTNGDLLDIQYADEQDAVSYQGKVWPDKPNLVVAEDPWGDVDLDNITESMILVLQYVIDQETTFTLQYKNALHQEDYTEEVYTFNEVVTLEVATHLEFFAYWMLNGEIVSYDSTFEFTILSDATVEAKFDLSGVDAEPTIVMSDNLGLRTGYVTHQAQFYLPDGYELIEYGFISTPSVFDTITLETGGIDRWQGDKFFGRTNEFLMSFDEADVQNPRAYLVYRDTENEIGVTYSESKNPVVAEREIEEREGPDMATMWIVDPDNGYILNWTPYIDDEPLDGVTVQEDGSIYATKDVIEQINYIEIDGVIYPITDFEDTVVIGDGN